LIHHRTNVRLVTGTGSNVGRAADEGRREKNAKLLGKALLDNAMFMDIVAARECAGCFVCPTG
jgi:hypothetical protein